MLDGKKNYNNAEVVPFSCSFMMRSNIIILFAVVIYLSSLQIVCGNDDEFAEFDDLAPNDIDVQVDRDHEPKENLKTQTEIKTDAGGQDESNLESVLKDENPKKSSDEKSGDEKPDLKLVNAPTPMIYKWESYYVEIGFVFAFMLYFINFLVGSNKNASLATQWYEQSRDDLKQQFVLVGGCPQSRDVQKKDDDSDSSSVKKQKGLVKANESSYTAWCSGRAGMDGLLIELSLLRRQDLFNMALNLLKPSQDNLILRFVLNNEGYENFVFCIANKGQAPRLAREMVDINTFCPMRKPISQYGVDSERLFVMSEIRDVTTFILDDKNISFLEKNQHLIDYIHITDQFATVKSEDASPAQKLASPKRMATFSFVLPSKPSDATELILFSLSLLDRLRRFKLARDGKQKSEKNRQKITDILQKTALSQRQEAAQLKKDELRRLEKERIYNEDDPAKQRKWEKKEAKREQKKNKMRVKQLKVKSM